MLSPLALVAVLLPLVSGAEPLVVNTTSGAPFSTPSGDGFQDRLIVESFGRIGRPVRLEQVPGERSLLLLEHGIDDGTAVRVKGLEKAYPHLVRVPEALYQWEFVAVGRGDGSPVTAWRDLAGRSLGHITGWKIVEANLPPKADALAVRNGEVLFRLLANRRVELVIYERWQATRYLRELAIGDGRIREPPLAVEDMYVYLHRRHTDLVDPLARAIADLRRDGTYERIFAKTLGRLPAPRR